MKKTIKKFRKKLGKNGHSLKFWHGKYAAKIVRYDYLIRMLNNTEIMRKDVFEIIKGYVGE